jgi:hypothetical protein
MAKTNAIVIDLQLTESGAVPTVPNPANLAYGDAGFNPARDLMIGQRAYNVIDKKWFHRSIVGIEVDANFTPALRTKLNGIEENANNYQHPETHSIDIIEDSVTHVKMTVAERSKLTAQPANPVTSVNGQTGAVTISVPEPIPDTYAVQTVLFESFTKTHLPTGGRFYLAIDKTNAQIESYIAPAVDPLDTKGLTINLPFSNQKDWKALDFTLIVEHQAERLLASNCPYLIQLGNTEFSTNNLKPSEGNPPPQVFELPFKLGHGGYVRFSIRQLAGATDTQGNSSAAAIASFPYWEWNATTEEWEITASNGGYGLTVWEYSEGLFLTPTP